MSLKNSDSGKITESIAEKFANNFVAGAKNYLPTPFTIAVLLTIATMLLALVLTSATDNQATPYPIQLLGFWQTGFWELLSFSMQMMLILVLGHAIALTKPVNAAIQKMLTLCKDTASSVFWITFFTIIVGLLNWGLGLIFGALFARKVAEKAYKQDIKINYPIIGAVGYVGLMVWHGGLSGSAPATVAGSEHFLVEAMGTLGLSQTVFSPMNICVTIALLVVIPFLMSQLAKKLPHTPLSDYVSQHDLALADQERQSKKDSSSTPAQKLDHSKILARIFGALILLIVLYQGINNPASLNASILNTINFILFGLGIFLFADLNRYAQAIEEAIQGAAGILIQFPLYAGIMGIMKYSGLIVVLSNALVQISTPFTLPLNTLISAGIVNVFVPSGGGQWAVQGPIIIEAARNLNVPFEKMVMALSYGDQLTNMMQPFWALPLLGITKLKAQEILPYTLCLMVLGFMIYAAGLMIF